MQKWIEKFSLISIHMIGKLVSLSSACQDIRLQVCWPRLVDYTNETIWPAAGGNVCHRIPEENDALELNFFYTDARQDLEKLKIMTRWAYIE